MMTGSTNAPVVGVLGAGQLGRMLALAGYPLGITFRFFDTPADAVAGQVGPLVVGSFDDDDLLAHFATGLDVATFEFENVPLRAARAVGRSVPFWPPAVALEVAQDRLAEKTFLQKLEVPTPRFVAVDSLDDLEWAVRTIDLPAVLKTRRLGYDGRGQYLIRDAADVAPAWEALGDVPLILEAFVAFDRELSILAVRNREGDLAFYPLVENQHSAGILRCSLAPAPSLPGADESSLQALAEGHATRIVESLGYVGVLAVEFFQAGDLLVANEIAPRVHNSGHWTIEGAHTSQFENHLRAILNWPLGDPSTTGYAAMLNLIGTLPDLDPILSIPGAHLHRYGKSPRPNRKLGHITVVAPTPDARSDLVAQLKRCLTKDSPQRE